MILSRNIEMGSGAEMNHVACDECTDKCKKVHKRLGKTAIASSGNFFFFNIMFKNFETILFIPKKACPKISCLEGRITSIQDSLGKSWSVQISMFENRLVFLQGWDIFVKEHDIGFGDFLVFQYVADKSSFSVWIFDNSGCERLQFPCKINSNKRNYTSKQKQGVDGDYCGFKSSIPNEDPTKIQNPDMERNQDDDGGIKVSIPKDMTTHKKTDFKRKRDDECSGFKFSIANEHLSKTQKSNADASDKAKVSKPIDYNHLLESMKRPINKFSKKMDDDDDLGYLKSSITNQDLTKIQKTNVDGSGQAKPSKKINDNDLLELMTCHLRKTDKPYSLQDVHDCIITVEEDGTCHMHRQQPGSSKQFESNAPIGSICGDTFTMDGNNAALCIEPGSDVMNFFNKFQEKPESTKQENPCKDTLVVKRKNVENSETEGHPKNDALSFIAAKHGNNDDIHIHAKSCNIKMSEKIDVEGGGNHVSCSIGVDSTVKEKKEDNMEEKSLAIVTTIKKTESDLFLLVPIASPTSNDLVAQISFRVTGNPHEAWLELSEEALPLPKKKERKVVLFRDGNLNVWPILYVQSKKFVGFLGGWQAFASTHDIQEGDLCLLNMASEFYSLFDVKISRM